MSDPLIEKLTTEIAQYTALHRVGRITAVTAGTAQVAGLEQDSAVGDRASVRTKDRKIMGEIVRLDGPIAHLMLEGPVGGVSVNDRVVLEPSRALAPDVSWVGRVIDPDGQPLDGRPLIAGPNPMALQQPPPAPHLRRPLGARLETGLAVFNTLLPIVQGQRIGLFAGSGVGKSTLLADLAQNLEADIVVIALVGERGREVRHFVEHVLGPEGMSRAIVVAATSDRAPQMRRNCALAATTVAEYFRERGQQVLLLVDSVTRYCEAHRELAVAAGEAANLRGFPASTASAIASLCERSGPGLEGSGDITAIYSVLVAGSDMEEPVADMLRGVLDGHVVLDRQIAEQGRFPAINVLQSVSRALPDAATSQENMLIGDTKRLLGVYERSALMIQSGLYSAGSDPAIDAAISCIAKVEDFLTIKDKRGTMAHFAKLRQAILSSASPMQKEERQTS